MNNQLVHDVRGSSMPTFVSRAVVIATLLALTFSAGASHAQTFTTLYTFQGGADGYYPSGLVVADGGLFGTTPGGGVHGVGTIFHLNASGKDVVYTFANSPDGANPGSSLIVDAAGNFYGTTASGGSQSCECGTVFKLSPPAGGGGWRETVLHSFGLSDGQEPIAPLAIDSFGNLFGTAFEISPSGAETLLYSFVPGPDGSAPYGGLVLDALGNVYGTTYVGGAKNCGTVFKLSSSGAETVLHSFLGRPGDGQQPMAGLIRDASGNLYGTTEIGGAYSDGTIFAMNSKGDREILYSFTGGADGARPVASLIMDKVGNLYGTAVIGGNLTACHDGNIHGCGTVFELSPPTSGGAWTFKVLYTFNGDANGAYPRTALTTDGAGNFYGTTSGCHSMGGSCPVYNYGTIFKITP
jgi:uncharacterized repeat protein (TIGR03803 family)